MKEQQELDIRLLELRENKRLTKINRWEFMRFSGTEVDVELSTDFNRDRVHRTITLQLGAHYTALRSQIRRRLLDYVIDVEFEIMHPDGLIVVEDDEITLTPNLLHLMFSIAMGALRGMIALRTANTFLAHFPLPVYNLYDLIEHIAAAGEEMAYNPEAY